MESQYFDVFNDSAKPSRTACARQRAADPATQDRTGLELALWVKNFTDEEYRTSMINLLDNFGYVYTLLGAPRTYGVEATWRF